jgi:hypothetical protein
MEIEEAAEIHEGDPKKTENCDSDSILGENELDSRKRE